MKLSRVAFALCLFASIALAQGSRGAVTGIATDPDGGGIAGAPVNAKNMTNGAVYGTVSTLKGNFTISGLPAGPYELSVPAIGFTYLSYVRRGLVLREGQTLRADIRLEWPINLGTVGDDYYLTIRNKYAGLTGPAPRMADGKPDLSGMWQGSPDLNPEPPLPQAWAAAVASERVKSNLKDMPTAYCLPGFNIAGRPLLYKIVQTASLIVELFEMDPHFRQFFLDGRDHPPDPDPTWQGHSTGKWDGDTLIIDTVGFNDKNWLPNALPNTEKLHTIERYRRPDLAHLVVDVTIDDPGALTKPWLLHTIWTLAPGEEIMEGVCENNQYRQQPAGK